MNFKKQITKFLSSINMLDTDEKTFSASSGFGGADPFSMWKTGKKISAYKIMQKYTGWVYAAISAISQEIAHIDLKLYRQTKKGVEEIYEHDLLDLLNGMNPYQPSFEIKHNTAAHLLMAGNAYWYLDGVENEGDIPTGIYLLPADQVQVIKGKFPELIKEYKFKDGATTETYNRFQIMHFKMPDPNDAATGIGVIQAIAQWIDADNYADEFNRRFFLNGARIGGFLESEHAITGDQLEYLKKSFEQAYSGVQNAYKVAALPKGTKFKEGQSNQKDIDFYNGQQVSRDKILGGFRVPKTILGVAEGETNRATAETADYVFSKRTIKPLMKLIVIWLNEFLVPRFGDDIYLDFDDPTPKDKEIEIKKMEASTGRQPVLSVNEAREKFMGLGPVENGDMVKGDIRLVDIGKPQKQKTNIQTTKRTKSIPKTRYSMNRKKRTEMSEKIAQSMADMLKDVYDKAKKDISKMTDDEYEILWKAFSDRQTPYEEKMETAVKEFNAKQLEEVLKNLEDVIKKIDGDKLFDIDEWSSVMVDATVPIVSAVYEQEKAEAGALLGFDDLSGLTPEAQDGLNKGMELMARKYNEHTITLLTEKLEIALDEGLGFLEVKNLVKEIYAFSDDVRAKQVARSEIFRAGNAATKHAWDETGVVKSVKWYTAADERVCEFCGPQHGKEIDIKEDFYKLGDEITGSDGGTMTLGYSDIPYPPLHVSCRCYIRPEEIDF